MYWIGHIQFPVSSKISILGHSFFKLIINFEVPKSCSTINCVQLMKIILIWMNNKLLYQRENSFYPYPIYLMFNEIFHIHGSGFCPANLPGQGQLRKISLAIGMFFFLDSNTNLLRLQYLDKFYTFLNKNKTKSFESCEEGELKLKR